jgi:hypothetical protein
MNRVRLRHHRITGSVSAAPAGAAYRPRLRWRQPATRRTTIGDDDRFFAELRACTPELARIIDGDLERPVPACPGWTLKQLASHVGRGHRWAAQIVATRASAPVSTRDVPNGRMPDDPAQHDAWLTESADLVAEDVAKADVAVRAPAARPLLLLTRRLPASEPGVEIFGEQALLTHWLERTPF